MEKILQKIQVGDIDQVYLIVGKEPYLSEKVLYELRQKISSDDNLNEITYDLLEEPIDNLLQEANEVSFFAEEQLLIAKNPIFLTSERKKLDFEHNLDHLLAYLKQPNPRTTLVFIANYEKLDERKKITKALRKVATVIDYSKDKKINIRNEINQYLQKQNLQMDNNAIQELIYLVGDNLMLIIGEINKLAIYCNGENITKEMVLDLVPKQLEHVVFDLVDYLLKGQKQQAIELYQSLLLEGEDTIKINYILVMQFRLMIQIKLLQQRHYQVNDIASSLKVHPYRVKKTIAQMGNLSLIKMANFFDTLVDFEEVLKSQSLDESKFFEMIILKSNF